MNLKELKLRLLQLDPYEIVDSMIDNFSPYLVLNLPTEMKDSLENLTTEEQTEWEGFCENYLYNLQYGVEHTKELMMKDI